MNKMGKGAMHQKPEEFHHGHLEAKNRERAVKRAAYAKLDATDRWVKGHISDAVHHAIHGHANEIIKSGGHVSSTMSHGLDEKEEKVRPTAGGRSGPKEQVTSKDAKAVTGEEKGLRGEGKTSGRIRR